MGSYFLRWLRMALLHSWGVTEAASSVLGIGIPLILYVFPQSSAFQQSWTDLIWQAALTVGALVAAVRLGLAPYWIKLEDDKTWVAKVAALEARLGSRGRVAELRRQEVLETVARSGEVEKEVLRLLLLRGGMLGQEIDAHLHGKGIKREQWQNDWGRTTSQNTNLLRRDYEGRQWIKDDEVKGILEEVL